MQVYMFVVIVILRRRLWGLPSYVTAKCNENEKNWIPLVAGTAEGSRLWTCKLYINSIAVVSDLCLHVNVDTILSNFIIDWNISIYKKLLWTHQFQNKYCEKLFLTNIIYAGNYVEPDRAFSFENLSNFWE